MTDNITLILTAYIAWSCHIFLCCIYYSCTYSMWYSHGCVAIDFLVGSQQEKHSIGEAGAAERSPSLPVPYSQSFSFCFCRFGFSMSTGCLMKIQKG